MAAPRVRETELRTKAGFVAALAALKAASPYSYARLGKLIDAPTSTVHGWCRGQHLPYARETERFVHLLVTLGVRDTEPWVTALNRLRNGDAPTPADTNPYRGLAPYTETDAHLYTRTDAALTDLLAAVDQRSQRPQPPPIVVLGPSGSGKTSLLRAGLAPKLAERGIVVQRIAAGTTLVDDLATLTSALAADEGPTGSHVVIVDQLEVALSADTADEVLDHLRILREHQHVAIVAARSDFFEHLSAHRDLRDGLADGPIIVTAPRGSEITDLIVRPAERAGLNVDPELVAELTRTFDDATTTGHVALPLLSHVLHQLAHTPERNTLTLDAYQRLGGIHHALAHAADDVWDSLDAPQRRACEALFLQLVQLGEQSHPTRRHLDLDSLDELADPGGFDATPASDAGAGFTRRDMEQVIDAFLAQRLLTIDQSQLAISHERLVTAWPRLEDWITAERAALLTSRRLTIAAIAWGESELDDEMLLTGVLLDEAIALREQQRLLLSPLARNFLARSEDRRRRDGELRAQLTSRQLAMQSALVPEPSVGAQLAVLAWQTSPTVEARSALLSIARRGARTRLLGEAGYVTVALAPDRQRAVVNHGEGHALELLAPSDGAWQRRGTVEAGLVEPTGFAWSPSGRQLAVAGGDGELAVVGFAQGGPDDLGSFGNRLTDASDGPRVNALVWIDDDRLLVAAGTRIVRWSRHHRDAGWRAEPVAGLGSVISKLAAITVHGTTIVAASTASGAVQFFLHHPEGDTLAPGWSHEPTDSVAASCVSFSPDGHLLAAGWFSGDVKVWRCYDDGAVEQVLGGDPLFGTWVNDVTFSPDGATLAAASSDGTVLCWSTHDWSVIHREFRHPSVVTTVDFVSEGVLTACEDGAVRLWGAVNDPGDPGSLWSAPIDTAGRVLTGSRNAVTRKPVVSIDPVEGASHAAGASSPAERWRAADLGVDGLSGITAATADGAAWAVGGRVGDVLWHDEFRIRRLTTGSGELIEGLDLGRNDTILLAADRAGQVTTWLTDRLDAGPAGTARVDPPAISTSIDPTGEFAVVACESGRTYLLALGDEGSLDELSSWIAGTSFSIATAFHPTERLVAIGNADGTVSIWSLGDVCDPVLVSRMSEPAGHVFGVAFSHEGDQIAGASTDGRVWVWDLADPAEPTLWASLESDSRGMYAVAFSHEDRDVIGVGARSAIRRWRLDTDQVADEVLRRAGDPMTADEWTRYVPPGIDRP